MARSPRFSFSYSRWSVWDECPRKYRYKHIDKLPEPVSPAMERGKKVHDEAAKFVACATEHMPAALEQFTVLATGLRDWPAKQKAVEQQMAFDRDKRRVEWFGANAYYRMIWDVGTWDADGTKISIVDWKTGKPRGSYTDQMEVFALPAYWTMEKLERFDAYLVYLDTGDVRPATVTRDEMFSPGGVNEKWRDNVARMEADTEFPAKPSESACRFCAFSWRKGGPCREGV